MKVSLPGFVSVDSPTRSEPIEVIDLSEGGSFVLGDFELDEGIEVYLTTGQGSATARVVHSDRERGMGTEFIQPDEHLREYVRRLLAGIDPGDDDPDSKS